MRRSLLSLTILAPTIFINPGIARCESVLSPSPAVTAAPTPSAASTSSVNESSKSVLIASAEQMKSLEADRSQIRPVSAAFASALASATAASSGPARRKTLFDVNRDGRISVKDLLKVAGLRTHVGNFVSVGMRGQMTMRNPIKIGAEALIDLADDGKIDFSNPQQLVGIQIANFRKGGRISIRDGGLRYTKAWLF